MRLIDKIFIDGSFATPHGTELLDLHNPATAQVIGRVRLADEEDARTAIAAAKRAFPAFSRTSKAERIALLRRMHAAMKARREELLKAIVEEYGAPVSRAGFMADHPANVLLDMARVLEDYRFTRRFGTAEVVMEPLGVAGLITPWNSDAGFICGKLAAAIAAGCTAVVKPSEMSAIQTQVVTEALHEAGLPAGVFNIVTGRGEVVGTEITSHPDVAKISFTGSTAVGKAILRAGAETMKRITLELGGKSPTVILDDANLAQAIPLALGAGFMNSGQACVAGTRILVPASPAHASSCHGASSARWKSLRRQRSDGSKPAIPAIRKRRLARWSARSNGIAFNVISVSVSTRARCLPAAKAGRTASTVGSCGRRCSPTSAMT